MNVILRVHYVYVKIAVIPTPSHIFNISFTIVFHFLNTSFTIPILFIHYSYSTPTFLTFIKFLKNLNILFIYIDKVHILFTIIDRFIHIYNLFIFNPVCERFNTWIVNNLLISSSTIIELNCKQLIHKIMLDSFIIVELTNCLQNHYWFVHNCRCYNLFTISCLNHSYLSIYNLFTIYLLFGHNQK